MGWIIGMAFAGGMPPQQTAAEQPWTDILMILVGVILISYIFAYAITHFAKTWRTDHKITLLSPSSSFARATLLAFTAFVGLWYAAFSISILQEHSWLTSVLIGVITSPLAPLAWNPMMETATKFRDSVAEKLKR